MATQIAPTPTVKGEEAKKIIKEMQKKPTQKFKRGSQILSAKFADRKEKIDMSYDKPISDEDWERFISQLPPLELDDDKDIIGYRDKKTGNYVLPADWDDNYDG